MPMLMGAIDPAIAYIHAQNQYLMGQQMHTHNYLSGLAAYHKTYIEELNVIAGKLKIDDESGTFFSQPPVWKDMEKLLPRNPFL